MKILDEKIFYLEIYLKNILFEGYQPRYLGDARRGEASPLNSVLCSTVPPPLVPRLRKEKARSGPPSPLNNIVPLSISKNDDATNSPPPPLYPRRTSPHFFPSPVLPPPPFRAPSITSCTAPTSPLSPSLSSAPTGIILRYCALVHVYSMTFNLRCKIHSTCFVLNVTKYVLYNFSATIAH